MVILRMGKEDTNRIQKEFWHRSMLTIRRVYFEDHKSSALLTLHISCSHAPMQGQVRQYVSAHSHLKFTLILLTLVLEVQV